MPADPLRLQQDCYEAYNIQVSGLTQRVRAAGIKRLVIGVSGGLDSTQALIVAARAFDLLKRPRTDILAYTMPGFGTSDVTKTNAWRLMRALGVSQAELDIRPAARQMLQDMDHPFARGEPVYDVTFENVQAGLRTDYLFRLANQHDGVVIGTGDLSELALGWCTYGVGDQMSHYNVNAGMPKTMIQHLIRWIISSEQFSPEVSETLGAILGTEISPELVPAEDGKACKARRRRSGRMRCRTSTCSTCCATAFVRRRSLSCRCMPGAMRRMGSGRRDFRRRSGSPTICPKSGNGCACSCSASSGSASSSGRRCPMGRRFRRAGRSRRGAIGARHRTAMPAFGSKNSTRTCPRPDEKGAS